MVPTDSLGHFHFGREVNKKDKELVDEMEQVKKAVSEEQESLALVDKELTELKSSVSVSSALAAKLV